MEEPEELVEAVLPGAELAWFEIRLVDDRGEAVAGEPYRVELSGGEVVEGLLDEWGAARLEDVTPGSCKVTFPYRDPASWEPDPKVEPPPMEEPEEEIVISA